MQAMLRALSMAMIAHCAKSALEYFNAIWELAELQTSEFWINAMKEIVTCDTLGRLAERVEAKIEDKTK